MDPKQCGCVLLALVLYLSLVPASPQAFGEEDQLAREDWVDPTDMLNYDLSKGSTRKSQKKATTEDTGRQGASVAETEEGPSQSPQPRPCDVTAARLQQLEQSLQTCSTERAEYKKSNDQCQRQREDKPLCDEPFFRQYIRQLLGRLHKDAEGEMHYQLTFKLWPSDLLVLEKFCSSEYGNIQDAHHVLSQMIVAVETVGEYRPPTWANTTWEFLENNIQIILQLSCAVALVCVSVAILLKLGRNLNPYRMAGKLFFVLFLVSIVWNWWHLYKVEVARQYSTMLKGVPAECKPSHALSMWEVVSQQFSLKMDACAKYHEKVMVDPLMAVPPTKAVAVTITKFFMEPLEHIGRAVGRTLHATLDEVPAVLWPFLLSVLVVVLLLVVFRVLGLKLRIFPFLTLEPAHAPAVAAAPVVQQPAVAAAPVVQQPAVAAAPVVQQPAVAAAPAVQQPAVTPAQLPVEGPQAAAQPAPELAIDELRGQEILDQADGGPGPAGDAAALPLPAADMQPATSEEPAPVQPAVEDVQVRPPVRMQPPLVEPHYDPLARVAEGKHQTAGIDPHSGARPKQLQPQEPGQVGGSGDVTTEQELDMPTACDDLTTTEPELKLPIPETQLPEHIAKTRFDDAGQISDSSPEGKDEVCGLSENTNTQTEEGESTTVQTTLIPLHHVADDEKQAGEADCVVTSNESGSEESSSTDFEVLPLPPDSARSAVQNIGSTE